MEKVVSLVKTSGEDLESSFFKFTPKTVLGKLQAESPSAGNGVYFKGNCHIGAFSYVGSRSVISHTRIGRYCSLAEDITIGATEHPTDRLSTHLFAMGSSGPFRLSAEFEAISAPPVKEKVLTTTIGNDVWIGAGAFIRRGVVIGNGAIIGARAVVTKNVDDYAVVGGTPAKPIRKRFDDETVQRLLDLAWWDYDLSPLKGEIDFSNLSETLLVIERSLSEGRLQRLVPETRLIQRTTEETISE